MNFESDLFVTISGYTIQHLTYSIINLITNAIGFFGFSNMYTKSPLDFSKLLILYVEIKIVQICTILYIPLICHQLVNYKY